MRAYAEDLPTDSYLSAAQIDEHLPKIIEAMDEQRHTCAAVASRSSILPLGFSSGRHQPLEET